MKRFNEAFKTKLYNTIKEIEDNSLIEIVVIIKPQSGTYRDMALWGGILFSFLLYTFFMFSPIDFNVFLIYVFTVLGFFTLFTLLNAFPELFVRFIPEKRKQRNVEINARAYFQKGGLHHTSQKIGTLFYFSLYEQKVFVLPDRGAETSVPKEEWDKIESRFQEIFHSADVPSALLEKLLSCKSIFSEYIPPVENDVNELPDNLQIEL